jgi:integrase
MSFNLAGASRRVGPWGWRRSTRPRPPPRVPAGCGSPRVLRARPGFGDPENDAADAAGDGQIGSASLRACSLIAPEPAPSSPVGTHLVAPIDGGSGRLRHMDADPPTLAAYLDEWFALQRTRVEPSTWESYDTVARAYLRPHLGAVPLDGLTVRALDLHYVRLLEAGGRRGQPLARRTVEYAHAVLRKALNDAVVAGLVADNPAERATVPRLDPRAGRLPARLPVWSETEAKRFLEHSADHDLADVWRVALGTGMRRGEVLGLRWEDVDLAVPQVTVVTALAATARGLQLKTTKTGRVRTLHLDEDTAAAIDRQPRRGGAWPLVFARADGAPLAPAWVSDRWRWQWPALDVPRIPLHGLRHTHACLLLSQGVPIKVVSQRLGHATIAMTMDTYAHVLPAQDRDAATAIASALGR